MTRVLVLAIALVAATAAAADDAPRRARVALALTGPVPPNVVAPCRCSGTGECRCDPAACPCCSHGLPAFTPTLLAKAAAARKPVVVWVGCELRSHCTDGALSCVTPAEAGGQPRVEVCVHLGGKLQRVGLPLPETATRAAVKAAVDRAAAVKQAREPAPPPAKPKPKRLDWKI